MPQPSKQLTSEQLDGLVRTFKKIQNSDQTEGQDTHHYDQVLKGLANVMVTQKKAEKAKKEKKEAEVRSNKITTFFGTAGLALGYSLFGLPGAAAGAVLGYKGSSMIEKCSKKR